MLSRAPYKCVDLAYIVAAAAISVGSARLAIDALTELRVVLDTRSGRPPGGGSLNSSTAMESSDETSIPQSTDPRSRSRRKKAPERSGTGWPAAGAGRLAPRSARQTKQSNTSRTGGV